MKLVLSLCDRTGIMVQPWAKAGYECLCVDMQHKGVSKVDNITFVGADVRDWLPPLAEYRIVFAFPPCTHLATSGARWFKDKGLSKLAEAIDIVDRCRLICEWTGAPYAIENPVSTLSTYWRKPDYTFNPYDFTAFELGDNYTKKTCLWTGGGFVMPPVNMAPDLGKPDNRIHLAPDTAKQGDIRSMTPRGFAQAVFLSNET
jgi:hypothetical protein